MYERFTDRARKAMALANQEATRLNHEYIGTEHILLGLIKEGNGPGAVLIKSFDIDLHKLRQEVERLTGYGADAVHGKLPQTPRAKKVIEYAITEARSLNHNYVGTEHLLLGLLKEKDGVAHVALTIAGLSYDQARQRAIDLLAEGKADSAAEVAYPTIDALTELLSTAVPRKSPSDVAGVFHVHATESGAMIVHQFLTVITLTSDDLRRGAPSLAASVMRSAVDRLEKAAAELRESDGKMQN